MRSKTGHRWLIAAAAMMMVAAPSLGHADEDGREDAVKVQRLEFPVVLDDHQAYTVVGYLYYQGEWKERTVQVALHGASYDHRYWDAPAIDGRSYSYARWMAARGWAVLALDIPGTGESSKPQGDFLDMKETALSLHQVLVELKTIHGHHGRTVIVGHSNGSILGVFVQATWHDADALVTTGWEHTAHPFPFPTAAFLPLLAADYVTIPFYFRGPLLYYPPGADPAVEDYDLANLGDTMSRGQFGTMFAVIQSPPIDRVADVTGPVFAQMGDHDLIGPSEFASQEASFYAHASSVTVGTLTDTGHAFNFHLSNETGWRQIDAWLRANAHDDRD